jgi:dihydrofolate reductase
MARPRISAFIAHSVDGYIATDDDGLGWLDDAAADGEDYGFESFLADVDAIAMGRGTYSVIEGFDELPYGERPVYVFTTRDASPRERFTFWSRSPEQAVAHWEERGVSRVYVDGGSLISQFLAAGLVDDLTLTTVPVLLGSGKPLFHRIPVATPLRLVDVTPFPSGMVNLRYARA